MATAPLGPLVRQIQRLAAGPGACPWPDQQLLDAFAARRDQAAFEALVGRHGPMVLHVCRRVLGHEQDAEDAFQATFLVLARTSGMIRRRQALAGWLHGVAYRTAMRAKRSAARRRNHEARLRDQAACRDRGGRGTLSPTWDDVQAILDEEIERLPDPYRAAFVLCVLEGKTWREAAADMGVKGGTVLSRVARARRLLQGPLSQRGIRLAALLAALSVAERVGGAGLPTVLARVTVRFGLLVAAGEPAAGVIPAHVAAMAAGVTRAMFWTKTKTALAVLLAAGLFVAGAGVIARQVFAAPEPEESPARNAEEPARQRGAGPAAAAAGKETMTYAGRVLGPDGRPVHGAKLHMTLAWGYPHEPSPSPEFATSGPDGRFTFRVPKAEFDGQFTVVAASAANHGVGWVDVPADGKSDDLTIRLVDDDVPITGQIVDLEGKPVAGATLRLMQINAAPGEDLGPWLKAIEGKKDVNLQLEQRYLKRFTIAVPLQVTTDAAGRFRLAGIGRNRLVRAQLDGPTIVSQHLQILTRPGQTIQVIEQEGQPEYGDTRTVTTYYGAGFRHVAAPCKPIIGVVRDKDTQKPLAKATVRSYALTIGPGYLKIFDLVRTTTDAEGRYRLTGMPMRAGNKIVVIPESGMPYFATSKGVPDSPGLDPVTVDVELKRGIWIEGKITDKVTGKPLQGAVEYFSLYSNPNLKDYPGFDGTIMMGGAGTKEDGSYRVVGLPGPGLVAVYSRKDHYLRAPERDDEYGVKEPSLSTSPYHISFTSNFWALARIDPAKGVDTVKRDVTLDPGWTFTGTLLGPDGKPLDGVRRFGTGVWDDPEKRPAEFTVRAFNPRRPRDIFFQHLEMGLVGMAQPPQENGGTVTVRMEPGAAIMGRLVDPDGKPRAGAKLELTFRTKAELGWSQFSPESIETDREGRFRIGALLPKYEYRLSDGKGELSVGGPLRLGQTKDLGDVRLKQGEN